MHSSLPTFTLLHGHCRLINATEGFRLEVRSGCLWLTRPGDAVDRFLVPGAVIDLHEAQVLIQSDHYPGAVGGVAARYVLVPQCVPGTNRLRLFFTRWVSRVGSRLQAHPLALN
jgi:hypothetical protein